MEAYYCYPGFHSSAPLNLPTRKRSQSCSILCSYTILELSSTIQSIVVSPPLLKSHALRSPHLNRKLATTEQRALMESNSHPCTLDLLFPVQRCNRDWETAHALKAARRRSPIFTILWLSRYLLSERKIVFENGRENGVQLGTDTFYACAY
jgi:hypothetical protein